jgi:hypothetical protein
MGQRVWAAGGTAALVAGPGLAIVALHRLGSAGWLRIDWADLPGWMADATLEEGVAAAARVIGLAAAYWLTGSTLIYLVASLSRIPVLIRAAGSVTLPLARRLVDGVVISTLAASTMAAPLVAVSLSDERSMPVIPPQYVVDPTIPPGPTASPQPASGHPPAPAPPSTAARPGLEASMFEVVVRQGDNLWTLAARRLEQAAAGTPSEDEIRAYWRTVIDANAGRIRSGDPDLIFPGEVIVLPPVDN